jgi:hypothetical protein
MPIVLGGTREDSDGGLAYFPSVLYADRQVGG